MTHATRTERLVVALILLGALGFRVWLLIGPFSEIDADEAVVGLMALQMPGELPAFYWEQHYLGTLEPMTAAVLFAAVRPSSWALKLAPAMYSVLFIGLLYVAARRAFGAWPAVLSALYLAVPPSFLAAWSVKARGGYPEALALGVLCVLAAQHLADMPDARREQALGWWALLGLAAGLALWTHPMSVVLVMAGGLYLLGALRPWSLSARQLVRLAAPLGAAAIGLLVGLGPAIVHNVTGGYPSLRFAADGGTEPRAALVNLWGLVRYGLPVLVGLAEGTPSRELLAADWPTRPGSSWLVTVTLPLAGLFVVWWYRRSLLALVGPGGGDRLAARGPALFVLVLLLVPPFVAVSRFANLWAEPRYALPIYAAVPLVTAMIWQCWHRNRAVGGALAVLLLGLNIYSLLASDYRLSLPTSAGASTAANRAELIRALEARGIDRIYTDYWLAYPIAFESREQIIPSVWSSGFGRRAVYSHLVFTAERPAFVFAQGTPGDAEFQARLTSVGGSAEREVVSIYHLYTNVEPLDPLRKP